MRRATKNAYVVFPSSWLRQRALENALCSLEKSTVIPTPVSIGFFGHTATKKQLKQKLGFNPSVPLVLFVAWKAWKRTGDLNKGYDVIERAIPRLRNSHNFQFVILGHGGGEIPGHLQALWVTPDGSTQQVAEVMRAADFVIGTSRQESLGLVIQEAHAVGTPAVVSDSTGYLEIVDHGKTGFHFRTGEADDLVAQASKILSSAETIEAMAAKAAEKAQQLWHPQVAAIRYRTAYNEAVGHWRRKNAPFK